MIVIIIIKLLMGGQMKGFRKEPDRLTEAGSLVH